MVALLCLAARPIVAGIPGGFELQLPIGEALLITVSGSLTLYLSTSSRPGLQRFGITMAYGTSSPVSLFAWQRPYRVEVAAELGLDDAGHEQFAGAVVGGGR